jgi:hypothetical protein
LGSRLQGRHVSGVDFGGSGRFASLELTYIT